MSSPSTQTQSPSKRRALSVWELPKLLQSVHRHRKTAKRSARERPHFQAILAYIHRNRFAVTSQIQRRFPKYLTSERTARRHLAEMETLELVDVVETNHVSPLWPKDFFVTGKGRARLRKALREQGQEWSESLQDRRRSDGTSANHVLHELFISEFLLMAWETAQRQDGLQILTIQRRSLTKHDAFKLVVAGRHTRLQPDGMFLYREADRGMMCCFIEVDMGSMSLRQMEIKFQRYQHWAEYSEGTSYLKGLYERHGATTPAAHFRLLVVAGSRSRHAQDQRHNQLVTLASKCRPSIRDRIWLSTVEQVHEAAKRRMLSESIWTRPRFETIQRSLFSM